MKNFEAGAVYAVHETDDEKITWWTGAVRVNMQRMRRPELDSDPEAPSSSVSDMEDGYTSAGSSQHFRTFSSSSLTRSDGGTPPESPFRGARKIRRDETLSTLEFGHTGTLQYRVLFLKDGLEISPWHSIPLYASDGLLSFVCKSPKGTWGQFEVAQNEAVTPIRLATRDDKPAHYAENLRWNLGFLPQTWADPELGASMFGLPCDACPVEALEIGTRSARSGDVYFVKPIAGFALINAAKGTLSWKVVTIAEDDIMADKIESTQCLDDFLPGTLESIREWLRSCYQNEPSDPMNLFGMNERAVTTTEVTGIIAQMHSAWQLLLDQNPPVPLKLPAKEEPRGPAAYEALWSEHTKNLAMDRITLADSYLGSTVKLDRAWLEVDAPQVAGTRSSEQLCSHINSQAAHTRSYSDRGVQRSLEKERREDISKSVSFSFPVTPEGPCPKHKTVRQLLGNIFCES